MLLPYLATGIKRLPSDFPSLLLLLREASYGARLLRTIISREIKVIALRHRWSSYLLEKHGKESESGHKAPTTIIN